MPKNYKGTHPYTTRKGFHSVDELSGVKLYTETNTVDWVHNNEFSKHMNTLYGWTQTGKNEYPNVYMNSFRCMGCKSILKVFTLRDGPDGKWYPQCDIKETRDLKEIPEDALDHNGCEVSTLVEVVDHPFKTVSEIKAAGWRRVYERTGAIGAHSVAWKCGGCPSKLRVTTVNGEMVSTKYMPSEPGLSHLDHKVHFNNKPRSRTVKGRTLQVVSTQVQHDVKQLIISGNKELLNRKRKALSEDYTRKAIKDCIKNMRRQVNPADKTKSVTDALEDLEKKSPFTAENRTRPKDVMYKTKYVKNDERDSLVVVVSTYVLVHRFIQHASVLSVDGTFFAKPVDGIINGVSKQHWQVYMVGFLNAYQVFVPAFYALMSSKDIPGYEIAIRELINGACLSVTGFELRDVVDAVSHDNEAAIYPIFECAVEDGAVNHLNCRVHLYKGTDRKDRMNKNSNVYHQSIRDILIKASTYTGTSDMDKLYNDLKSNFKNDTESFKSMVDYYLTGQNATWLWCQMQCVRGIEFPAANNMSLESHVRTEILNAFTKNERGILELFEKFETELLQHLSNYAITTPTQPRCATDMGYGDVRERGWLFNLGIKGDISATDTATERFQTVARRTRTLLREDPYVGIEAVNAGLAEMLMKDYYAKLLKSRDRNKAWSEHMTKMMLRDECPTKCDVRMKKCAVCRLQDDRVGIAAFRKKQIDRHVLLAEEALWSIMNLVTRRPEYHELDHLSHARPHDIVKFYHERCNNKRYYLVFPLSLNAFKSTEKFHSTSCGHISYVCTCPYFRNNNFCEHSQAREFIGEGMGRVVNTGEDMFVSDFFRDEKLVGQRIFLHTVHTVDQVFDLDTVDCVGWDDKTWRDVLDNGDKHTLEEFLDKEHAFYHAKETDPVKLEKRRLERGNIISLRRIAFDKLKTVCRGNYEEFAKLEFPYRHRVCEFCSNILSQIKENEYDDDGEGAIWNGVHERLCPHFMEQCMNCEQRSGSHSNGCGDAPKNKGVEDPLARSLAHLKMYVGKMKTAMQDTIAAKEAVCEFIV